MKMWTRVFFTLTMGLLLAVVLCAVSPVSASASTGAGSSHASAQKPADPLEFDKDLALWTGVVFLVLVAILYKAAWGPLRSGLDQRENHIANQIAQANAANQQAKDLLAGYEKKLAEAAQEVRVILDKARNDADQAAREREAKAEADAKARIERAEKEIAAATSAAAKDLADRSARLAVDLAGKIVRAKLSPKDHAQLIEQAVSNFAQSGPAGKFANRN